MEKEELSTVKDCPESVDTEGSTQEAEQKDATPEQEVVSAKPIRPRKKLIGKLSVKAICYCAVLVALSVIANTFTVYFNFAGSNALSFTYTVCFLAGAFFGPFAGFIVGACGDLIGWLINPAGGAFNPLLTLTSGLLGLIPGIVFMVVKKFSGKLKKPDRFLPLWTAISFVFVWLVCTNANTAIMYYFYIAGFSKKFTSLIAYYVYRIPFQTLFWSINLVCSALLIVPLKKMLKL
ncbi:MAG: folate family ECF transporter S component [Clostridia bacterium]|nr:folate family ECF transporter S component [Clostridia bacterium]